MPQRSQPTMQFAEKPCRSETRERARLSVVPEQASACGVHVEDKPNLLCRRLARSSCRWSEAPLKEKKESFATSTLVRWLKFNLVGIVGTCLQMAVLAGCTYWAKLPYLLGTMLAVECTILHNFLWHERFTWRDRPSNSGAERALRLLRFNSSNGLVSLVGNLLIMRLLIGQVHLPVLWANGGAILVCSVLNFVVGEQLVFRPRLSNVTTL